MLVFNMRLTAQQKKNLYYLVPLIVLLIGTLLFYFFAIRVRPNDKILTNSDGVALFANENPTFEVQFGDKENPDGQWVRFEAKASNDNPFSSEEKKNIFTKIASLFTPNKKTGIEMSLRGVDFSETKSDGKAQQDEEIQKVADILGTEEIKTSTVLTEMGREIGGNEGDQIISKQTIINQGVADGVDLEYQVLKGLGLKEEIVINDLEAYRNSCDEGCKLPLNEFVFDLKVDDGVVLKKGWFTVDGKSSEVYYFVDGNGKYLAHFLPSYAVDDAGDKTYEVDLKIEEVKVGNYEAKVTVNSNWLLDPNRVYPIRIDPSIVHDDTTDFSGGIFDRVGSLTGPKILLDECTGGTISYSGGYKIHTFTASDTFYCVNDKNVEVLVVAGGGGGGTAAATGGGGGGGAGGVLYSSSVSASTGSNSVTVGSGGSVNANGGNSSILSLTAIGGGYGGNATNGTGNTGGSGGGSRSGVTSRSSGTSGQGYAGGIGNASISYGAGGGGGASAQGYDGTTGGGSNGGAGVLNAITGTAIYYGGGGGGSFGQFGNPSTPNGGIGGGGSGGTSTPTAATAGTANTGGGGGGGWNGSVGAAGGSGIVIVRYKSSPFGMYTSSSLDFGSAASGMTMSWLASGVNTGNGETPYSTTGMVAQWNFNETSGTTAVSGGTCGTSCNGTLTNMTTTGQDAAVGTGWTDNNRRWGTGAVMTDGSNDYVSITDNVAINPVNLSVEMWVKPNGNQTGKTILSKYSAVPAEYELGIDNNGYLIFRSDSSSTAYYAIDTDRSTSYTGWIYVVGTYDTDNKLRIYVNGVLKNISASFTRDTSRSDNLNLGRRPYTGAEGYFNGIIDSTRIYSRALSDNEILSNYQSGNIEFQYRTSDDGNTWSNWTSYNDGALIFDGNDDHIVVDDVAAVDSLTSFSTCAWVNNDTLITDSMIWSKVDNTTWSGIMFVKDIVGQVSGRTNTYKIWVGQNSAAAFIEGATNSATIGAWQHVCATYTANSATGLRLYVNGVEDANSPVSTVGITSIDAGTSILNIGKYNPGTTSYMDGSIDNIQIYNRVLTGSEIASNYTMPDFETPYSSSGLLANWKFNELSDTTAVSGGTCGIACNGTLTNFSSTTGRDSSTISGWTAKTKLGSDYPEYSFDNPYLYKTDDTGLIGYWPMEEVSGTGAYIKDVSVPFAIGGTVTYSGGYTIHTFTSNGTFVVNGTEKVEILTVGGGGGAGGGYYDGGSNPSSYNGGGGGGEVIYLSSVSLNPSAISVTIGSGGIANNNNAGISGGAGVSSVFGSYTARGGAGGYFRGHGGANGDTVHDGGIKPADVNIFGAGGGGGAGQNGFNGVSTSLGGAGGNGVAYTISGSSVYYGGGGGGGGSTSISSGGLGGGGYGNNNSPQNGFANTGGGGGGGSGSAGTNGSGGTGIVIVRYPSSYTATTIDTIGDTTPTGTTYVSGKSGGARSFNGSSDVLSCTDASCGGAGKLDVMTGSISISTWVKPNTCSTVSVSPGIIDKFDTATSKGYLIYNEYYSGANVWTFYDPVNSSYARSTTPCVVGAWTYITAVYDSSASTKKMYINGKLETTLTGQSPMGDSGSDFNIGRYRNAGLYYNGIIDEVRIFNTALSASTISSDYISGIANKGSVLSQNSSSLKLEGTGSTKLTSGAYGVDSNTVGLWHLDERSGTGAYIKDSLPGTELPFATGGTVTYSGGYTIHTFTSSGSFVANASGNVDVLVVGGGGGGGGSNGAGGGGGAGGVTYSTGVSVAESTYTVTVGTGGNGSAPTGGSGVSGVGSSLGALVTAVGGGGGGGYNGSSTTAPGSGGSGGGGGSSLSGTFGGASGTAGQGYAGGNGLSSGTLTDQAGGGGGGASQVGTASTVASGGNGGNGVSNSITGTAVTYGGGGGGGKRSAEVAGTGGSGGGGNGGLGAVGSTGTNGLGGGGGGGANGYAGGNGGSGVVIVRYPSTQTGGMTGNHGTPTGTTYTNAGKIGGARSFNGTTDYIRTAVANYQSASSLGTMEAWIKLNNLASSQTIFQSADEATDNYWLQFRVNVTTGKLSILQKNNDTYDQVSGNTTLSLNEWHHVAAVSSGTAYSLYVDGSVESLTVGSGSNTGDWFSDTPNRDNIMIGMNKRSTSSDYMNGYIDEVRISNVARTASEIAESYKLGKDTYINQTLNTIDLSTKNTMAINIAGDRPGTYLSTTWGESAYANSQSDANTVGLWHMDEISGSGAYIQSATGNNNGTPTGTTYTSSGKLGGARSFNGSSDYVVATRNTSLNSTFDGSYTLSMWFNSSSTVSIKRMWGMLDASSGYHIAMLNYPSVGKIKFYAGTGTDANALDTTRSNLNDGQWHYVVFQIDGTTQRIYVDGILDASKTRVAGTASDENFYIGKSNNATTAAEHFAGTMDEIRVDNVARTADQIRQAYEIGLRTHNITVTFGAGLASGNLITGSGDYGFNIDATKYGLPSLGSELYAGDKVIIKENYNGTESIAQGTVSSVNLSTGAVTVSSWDSGSTFPSSGYTVNADVFKWQKEYIPVKNRTISNQVDATNLLTFRLNDGNEGRNIWIDDLRSSTGYLKNSSNEVISFASNAQYVQYKTVFSSWDSNVTPYLSQVQIDYDAGGPTIDQLMRHGQWLDSSGAKQGFWWVGTH